MATTSDIAHRWANQRFGKRDGKLTAGNTFCDETSFYSYSTVIAQWLDRERKIMAIIDQGLTRSTSRHVSNVRQAVTHDTTVFYFHCSPSYGYEYANVNVCGYDGKVRSMYVTENYINLLYGVICSVQACSSLDAGSLHWWNELLRWQEYFPEASVKKWLRLKFNGSPSELSRLKTKRKMVRALLNGATFEETVDVVNGVGTWKEYLRRTKAARKRADNHAYATKIAQYLGFFSLGSSKMTVSQILNLTPAERLNIKLGLSLSPSHSELVSRKVHSINNLQKYLGIQDSYKYGYFDFNTEPKIVIDPVSGLEVYNGSLRSDWRLPFIRFEREDIEKAKANPVKYREWFLNKAKTLGKLHHGSRLKSDEILTAYDLECYQAYQEFTEKCSSRLETRKKRAEEERLRFEAERKAQEAERKRIIESYRLKGIDGYRDLWRDRYDSCPDTQYFNAEEFFYGGNVLLRFNPKSEQVETSKNIRLSINQAQKLWKAVTVWHLHPEKFKRIEIATQNSKFIAHSFENDILVAGCHSIAYSEMERMAKKLNFIPHESAVS